MRTLFLTACSMLLFGAMVCAQSNSADCRTAIPLCADAPVMGFADGLGAIEDFDPDVIDETGCLAKGSVNSANIEHNTSWFVFRAGTEGQLGFDIESISPAAEWDFAVYGPDVACADISNGTAVPVRCNYEVNGTDYTGLGINPQNGMPGMATIRGVNQGNNNTYDEYLEVRPGELYYILINNYATTNTTEYFMMTFTGSSVQADQNAALDCSLRDEFLGLDIIACEGDPDIILTALNSPAGSAITDVQWSVDYDDDGTVDDTNLPGIDPFDAELIVSSPNTGRYFADITTSSSTTLSDVGGVFVEFFGPPELSSFEILDTNLTLNPDRNDVEFMVDGNSDYEFAINGGEFQDDPIFRDVPPGNNTVIINDKNGCGTIGPLAFFVVAYPKFFTPNGDGINETWNIKGIQTLNNPVVFIFDRYGKLIRQLNANNAWDGTFNGEPMPSSDYWFRFEYNDELLIAKTRKSHFTLKR